MMDGRRRRNMKRALPLVATAVTAAVVVGCGGSDSSGAASGGTKEPIVIGVAAVQSGPLATFGVQLIPAIKLAVQQINAKGGVIGRKLQVVTADTKGTGAGAVAAVQTLLSHHPVALMGTVLTAEETPLVPVLNNQAKIPFLGGAVTSSLAAGVPGGSDWLFRVIPSDRYAILPLVSYAKSKYDLSRVGVITTTDDLGHSTLDQLTAALRRFHLGKPAIVRYTEPDAVDFTAAIQAVKRANPSIVFQQANAPQTATFLRQSAQQGLDATKVMGTSAVYATFYNKLADPKLMSGNLTNVDTYTSADAANAGARSFFDAYKQMTGKPPTEIVPIWYGAVMMLANAIEQAKSTNADQVAAALRKTKDFTRWRSFQLPDLKFTCDEHQNCNHTKFIVTGTPDGSMKLLSRYEDSAG